MRGRFPIGTGTGFPLRGIGGSATATLTADNLPPHRHQFSISQSNGYAAASGGEGNRAGNGNNFTNVGQTYLEDGTTPVSNSAFSILNPYISMNYIIRYQ
jgi:microcystin-dependent protein